MRSLLAAIGIALVSVGVANGAKPPYTLTIAAKTPTVKAGQDVEIEVMKHNTSNQNVNCGSAYDQNLGVNISLEYVVRDETGTQLDKKPHEDRLGGHMLVDSHFCTLPPGETNYSGSGAINSLYDMTKPGHYTVQIRERLLDKDNKVVGWVKSNVITVNVTP